MVVIKSVSARYILDSRKEKTIFVCVNTNKGKFSASAPNGKSKGKHEAKSYKKSLEKDIETLKKFKDYFSDGVIEEFNDLRRIEDTVDGHVGANTLFALESAILKAMAKEQKKEVWQLIDPDAKKFPRLVGNVVGGGKHVKDDEKKPDFQEFLLIPKNNSVKKSFEILKHAKSEIKLLIKEKGIDFQGKKTDEDAWRTKLNCKEIFDLLKNLDIPLGTDVAASSFYKRKKYHYNNPMLTRTIEEQLSYISNLIKNFNLYYIEDPFDEEDFLSFGNLCEKHNDALIVGDDLTVTNVKRFQKAIDSKSINAIIVKPNQNGSLIQVKEICDMANKNDIKIVFSHRSGETNEDILADLAFGFGADFLKCGITGKERESKIKRLIKIEKGFK